MAIRVPIQYEVSGGDLSKGLPISGFTRAGTQAGQGFTAGLGKGTAHIGAVIGAVSGAVQSLTNKGINLLTSSIGAAVNRVDTLSNANRVFSAMGFSVKDTSAAMSALNKDITGLPTPLDQAVKGTQLLAAASQDVGTGEKVYSALNDAILGLGGTSNDVSSAVTQFGQAISAGKVDAATFNSLVQSGMGPALIAIGKDMGMTAGQLKEGLSTGKISVQQFNAELVKMNMQGGGGMMSFQKLAKAATSGIGTSFANMKTSVVRGLADIISSIGQANIAKAISLIGTGFESALKAVAGATKAISAAIGKAFSSKGGQKAISSLVAAVKSFATNVASAGRTAGPALLTVGKALAPLLKIGAKVFGAGLVVGIRALGVAAKAAATIFAGFVKVVSNPVVEATLAAIGVVAAAAFGPALVEMAGMTAAMIALNAASVIYGATTKLVAAGQWLLNAAMSANPIGLVVVAIAALVAAFVVAYNRSATFRAIVQGAFAAIKTAVVTTINVIKPVVQVAFAAIATYIRVYMTVARTVISAVWTAIKTVVRLGVSFVKTNIATLSVIGGIFSKVFNGARAVLTNAWNVIKTVVRTGVNLVKAYINGISAIVGVVSRAFNAVVTAVRNRIASVVSTVKGLAGKVTGALGGLAGEMAKIGSNIVMGLVHGIENAAGAVAAAVAKLVAKIPGPIRKAMGIHSPSRVMAEIGQNITQGLVQGMSDTRGIAQAVNRIGTAVTAIPINPVRPAVAASASGAAVAPGTNDGVSIAQNFYGPTTSGGRLKELDWTIRFAAKAQSESVAGAAV